MKNQEIDLKLYFVLQYLELLQSCGLPYDVYNDINDLIYKINGYLFEVSGCEICKIRAYLEPYDNETEVKVC